MKITFDVVEKSGRNIIDRILFIEKSAFGKEALSEYVLVPIMRHGRIYLAADEDGNAVGCAYFLRDMTDIKLAYLLSVAVLPAYAGYEIGIALLDYALSDLKAMGLETAHLTVDPANFKALSTYRERLGFTVANNPEDEYGMGEERLMMVRKL